MILPVIIAGGSGSRLRPLSRQLFPTQEMKFLVTERQSTYIPLGVTHLFENPVAISLELIEVQSGSHFGKDDIVRFEDKYSRV